VAKEAESGEVEVITLLGYAKVALAVATFSDG